MERTTPGHTKDLLAEILRYLLLHATYTSERALHKLLYLTDLYYYQKYGRTASNVQPIRGPYGPFYSRLPRTLEQLAAQGEIKDEYFPAARGRAHITRLTSATPSFDLPEDVLETLQEVLQRWGNCHPDELVQHAKSTRPYLDAAFGHTLDFSRAPHFTTPIAAHLRHLLDLPEPQTGSPIQGPEDPKYQSLLEDLRRTKPLRDSAWKAQVGPDE